MENRSLLLSLLRKGQTGEEITSSDDDSDGATLNPIDF
jgi:hypothetical protein